MRGLIIYQGPSEIDGNKTFAVMTDNSSNPKTGPMLQTYILADARMTPLRAALTGRDTSICGDCPLRGRNGKLGPCYVDLTKGPNAVYRTYKRGGYAAFDPLKHARYLRGRALRIGSYGDPAAVPLRVWEELCRFVKSWTGYTHQWRTCSRRYSAYCMASVESAASRNEAMKLGYRTFRIRTANQPIEEGEFVCPASAEAGHRLTCLACGACGGLRPGRERAASPTIIVHGLRFRVNLFEALFANN